MNLIAGTVSFGVVGAFLPLTLYLQSVQGPSAARVGPAIAVMPLASVTAGISGRSSRRPALTGHLIWLVR
ncbi:hypothetical protein [Streptomyces sp. NPDC101149]|uniref:hypothetical protein n=1 Tax=Streptomyces sp. NPDC101149 TaxID=3366113 RepID=UPI0038062708